MRCYVCEGEKGTVLLDKPPGPMATGAADGHTDDKFSCMLVQCGNCGHVFEPVTDSLREGLRKVYSSKQAQLSVSMGVGNWGQARAEKVLKHVSNVLNFGQYRSALEIGCDKGFFLEVLAKRGIPDLMGIEPSLPKAGVVNGIHFLKEFVREDLSLGRKFDLIYAFDVFDHVENITGVMKFAATHLNVGGDLFFTVTNADRHLSVGSPTVFTHQHVQCFTKDSLRSLLMRSGLVFRSISEYQDEYHVIACHGAVEAADGPFVDYGEYSKKLEKNLLHVQLFLSGGDAMVHGANNALKNILEWIEGKPDFVLIDNDECKYGKSYFGKIVHSIQEVDLNQFKKLLIVPDIFLKEIREGYLRGGFRGKVTGVLIE